MQTLYKHKGEMRPLEQVCNIFSAFRVVSGGFINRIIMFVRDATPGVLGFHPVSLQWWFGLSPPLPS